LTDDDRQRAAGTPAGDAEGGATPAPPETPPETPGAAPEATPADPPASSVRAEPDPDAERARSEEALGTFAEGAALRGGILVVGKKRGNWFDDLKAIFWLLLAVLAFHSCVAKPFYIPSESMMPGLLKGDRLVVSKYPYGWSWVSPSFHIFPRWQGRIWGAMPRRGDVVIVTPPGESSDYIKRVIGLPGDTIAVVDGQIILNGRPVRREARPDAMIPIDGNIDCKANQFVRRVMQGGREFCRMRVFREYIPDGAGLRAYDTIDAVDHDRATDSGPSVDDWPYDATFYRVPADHVFLMGDNRDDSADSRVPLESQGLGGAVPWENIGGRAEFITFSLDGSSSYWNPISWFTALRGGRAGTSLHPTDTPAPPAAPASAPNQGARQ
jgi:signal peptidase I